MASLSFEEAVEAIMEAVDCTAAEAALLAADHYGPATTMPSPAEEEALAEFEPDDGVPDVVFHSRPAPVLRGRFRSVGSARMKGAEATVAEAKAEGDRYRRLSEEHSMGDWDRR